MALRLQYIMPFIFFMIPLSYSIDNDPYRAWEVLFWGGFTMLIALTSSARFRAVPEFLVIFIYATVLILQQFFIPDGKLWFGAQYALVFAAAFLPSLLLGWLPWSMDEFSRYWDAAIKGLSLFILANIFGARLLGWGELYVSGLSGGRYFGYLGDSISPVIVFPLIYYLLERRYIWMMLMVSALILTGGKAAAILLAVAPFLILVLRMRPLNQFIAIASLAVIAFILEFKINDFVRAAMDNPVSSYSINTRMISIKLGLQYFMENPIWGVGINQSMVYIGSDANALAYYQSINEYWQVNQIHNAFIRALAETGIVGFGVLVGLCVLLIRRAYSSVRVVIDSASSRCRSIVIAGGIWTILFIFVYQSTGWFEHGHPQFAWLLIIAALTSVGARLLVEAPEHAGYGGFTHGGFAQSEAMRRRGDARSIDR